MLKRNELLSLFDKSLRECIVKSGNCKDKNHATRLISKFWPTEASAMSSNGIVGRCRRQTYYNQQMCDTPEIDFESVGRFYLGRTIETWLMEEFRVPGPYIRVVERNKKLSYVLDNYSKITISGEIDSIYEIKKNNEVELIGGEIKTSSGFTFQNHVFHRKTIPGMPKIEHVLQVSLYLYYFRFINTQENIDRFVITYYDRGSCEMVHHTIELGDDLIPIINGIKMAGIKNGGNRVFEIQGLNRQKTQAKLLDYEINIDNVFKRFEELYNFNDLGILPPKDYNPMWGRVEIDKALNDGSLTQARLKEYEKGHRAFLCSDECNWCPFRKKCMEDEKII